MKVNKLNELAYKMGFKTAVNGKSKTLNPFNTWDKIKSENWNRGWNDGIESINTNQLNEGLFDKYVNAFFTGLTRNTVNSALKRARKNDVPDPIVSKMIELKVQYESFKKVEDELKDLLKRVNTAIERNKKIEADKAKSKK